MSKEGIPALLNVFFLIHFLISILIAIPLIFMTKFFLVVLGWKAVEVFTARLVGAALLAIGTVSLLAINKDKDTYESLLFFNLVWSLSAIIGILMSMFEGFPKVGWIFFATFVIFGAIWNHYLIKINLL